MDVQSYPAALVTVPADRQRRSLGDTKELAASIQRVGLINPIVITRDGVLVAGERRLTAVRSLGWTHIPVHFLDDLPDSERKLIEWEENFRRTDLTWQERCSAVLSYHTARRETDPSWTQEKTAEYMGVSPATIHNYLGVGQALEQGHPLLSKVSKASSAINMLARERARAKAQVAETLAGAPPATPLLHADFHEWQPAYAGPRFNLIHCDFPYGIDATGNGFLGLGPTTQYRDKPADEAYPALLDRLQSAMTNVIADSAHLIFWFSMNHYTYTFERLTEMGWRVLPRPLIWHKAGDVGIVAHHARFPRNVYETALFAARGDRPLVRPVANHYSAPIDNSVHVSAKPHAVLRHFFQLCVDQYTTIFDPTCGSGNALKVALELGASAALGLEKELEIYEVAFAHYKTA